VEEPQKSVVHKVCDTVSELAAELLDKGEWPEVLPALQGLITSGSPCAMEAGLLILADLAGYSTDHLRPHLAGLQPLLAGCLSNSSIEVQVRCWRGSQGARGQQGRMWARHWHVHGVAHSHSHPCACVTLSPHTTHAPQVAALTACCSFINALDEARERETFQPLLVPMLAALVRSAADCRAALLWFAACTAAVDTCWFHHASRPLPTASASLITCCRPAQGRCLSAGDENAAQDVLELLIEVAESYPRFLRKHLQELVSAMMQVKRTSWLFVLGHMPAAETSGVTACTCHAAAAAAADHNRRPAGASHAHAGGRVPGHAV
jgi:hypothetical protein